MRVFVTGTGRCGTCTFYQACTHISNYTCGHESQAGRVQGHEYADNHIEVSSHLVLELPSLLIRYPDSFLVHLVREKEPCVESLLRNCWDSMACYSEQWHQAKHPYDVVKAASRYYDQVNEMCLQFCHLTMRLETIEESWMHFCDVISAGGDRTSALGEFKLKYNSAGNRGLNSYEGE